MTPDVENQFPGAAPGSVNGIEGHKRFVGPFLKAFPDARITIVSTMEAGDTIVTEGVYGGTHTGPMEGPQGTIPPTGRKIELPFADIFKVRGGKVVAHHLYFDQMTFMAQLGLTG
jgi:predicted ester cyclase